MISDSKLRKGLAVALAVIMIGGAIGQILRWREARRTRIVGEWRVADTVRDWYFVPDGRFLEDGLVDVVGTYELTDDGNLEISVESSVLRFELEFGDGEVLLRGLDGTALDVRLLKKR